MWNMVQQPQPELPIPPPPPRPTCAPGEREMARGTEDRGTSFPTVKPSKKSDTSYVKVKLEEDAPQNQQNFFFVLPPALPLMKSAPAPPIWKSTFPKPTRAKQDGGHQEFIKEFACIIITTIWQHECHVITWYSCWMLHTYHLEWCM